MRYLALLLLFAAPLAGQEKPRLYVDSEISLDNPQVGEITDGLNKHCPQVTVTGDRERANYYLRLDHQEAGPARKRNRIVLMDHNHDVIYTNSTRSMGNAIKDVCQAIVEPKPKKK